MLGENFNSIQTTNKDVIVDKNPSNFYWIGFIKLMFPSSKIIHIKRNLRDVGLSLYKNLFGIIKWTGHTVKRIFYHLFKIISK